MGAVSTQGKDILPVVRAHIKGQSISNVLIDGGDQVCVMSERLMHCLGLEAGRLSEIKAKLANNKKSKFVGIIKGVKVSVLGAQVPIDMYVLPMQGEGYPLILGRPRLIAIKACQDWEKGTIVLKPEGKREKPKSPIVYSLIDGEIKDLNVEASKDEWST